MFSAKCYIWRTYSLTHLHWQKSIEKLLRHSHNANKTDVKMGNADTKLNFRKAVIQLTTKTQVNNNFECTARTRKM